jgi:lipopolysaccharide transport system permease protein
MGRTIVTPPRGVGLPHWRELWEAREVLWRFGTRDILLRYRQTAIGVAWVVLQPLVAAGIFSILFGQVAQFPSDGVPYFVFSFAGLLGWNLLNGVISRSSGSLVSNQALVSKVFFPRLLVPLGTSLSTLLDFVVASALFAILLIIFGISPGLSILLLPLWVICTLLIALGVGVAATAIMVKYRDVAYVLPWIMQVVFYATPVAYSLRAVPPDLVWIFQINPLSWLMEAYRWSLLNLTAPPLWQLLALGGISLAVFLGGILVFQRLERGFADII